MEQEIGRWIGAASAVMWSMRQSVLLKEELTLKVKLSIYRSIYFHTLTYGHELWVMTERTRSQIQAPKFAFSAGWLGDPLEDFWILSIDQEKAGSRLHV